MMQDDDGGLVEAIARAVCRAWYYCDLDKPDGVAHWQREQDKCRKQAAAALSAIEREGFKVVPVEPTEEMVSAYWAVQGIDRAPCEETWAALLSAAPKQG